jgi:hypothetical protein
MTQFNILGIVLNGKLAAKKNNGTGTNRRFRKTTLAL